MIQYAIFDMDGTLTDSMGVWEYAPRDLLARHGLTAAPDLRPRLMELTQEDGARLILSEYPLGMTLPELFNEFYDVVSIGYEKVLLKEGARPVLENLAAAGVKMAVASSTRKDVVDRVLTRLGVRRLFVDTFSCRDGYGKKQGPFIFEEAAAALGAKNPGEVWVFEDAHHAVLSAKSGGFPVAGIYDRFCVASPAEMAAACDVYWNSWLQFDAEQLTPKHG